MIEIVQLPGREPVQVEAGVAFLHEWSEYLVRLAGPEHPQSAEVDRRELDWDAARGGWLLKTGFEAGELKLELRPAELGAVRIRVTPDPEKLGEAQWLRIVEDVERWLPAASVGLEGTTHGRVGARGSTAPLLASALGPLVEPMRAALERVVSEPREQMIEARREVPAHSVRRAAPPMLRWLSRHPTAWEALGHAAQEPRASEPLVPVRWSDGTRDHPMHRYLVWLIERALTVVARCAERLRTARSAATNDRTGAWCGARAEQMERAWDILERARRRSWLRDVAPAPVSEAALLGILDDPAYARLHALLRRFARPLFTLDGDESVGAPVRATYDLYEIWCFLAIQRELKRKLAGARWFRKGVSAERFADGRAHGARFAAELPSGRLELHFNATFPGYLSRGTSPRYSISGERRPDIVATWKGGGAARWACVDAKYRVRPDKVAEAFGSAHVYRDALRWDDRGGRCEMVLLAVPNMMATCAPWFSELFLRENSVGAAVAAPGFEAELLVERLLSALRVRDDS